MYFLHKKLSRTVLGESQSERKRQKIKTKEHWREAEDKITDFSNLGIGCKIISKRQDIPVSTTGSIVRKWKLEHTTEAISRPGPPSKCRTKTRPRLVRKVTVRPTVLQSTQWLRVEWRFATRPSHELWIPEDCTGGRARPSDPVRGCLFVTMREKTEIYVQDWFHSAVGALWKIALDF